MPLRLLLVLAVLDMAALGCGSGGTAPATPPAAGTDTTRPYPIDRGGAGNLAPTSYKGLPLRLTPNAEPSVTPVDGVIGLVCVGMSNGNQECGAFQQRVRGEWAAEVNAAVRVVNCAVGGHAIERWIDPAYDAVLWDDCLTRKAPAAGVRPNQVRVLWHKAANQFTTAGNGAPLPLYPDAMSDYAVFLRHLEAFAARVTEKFPSVQAVYSSSRSYGGFAVSAGRGEPLSYEEGHALNSWLASHPTVGSVWHGWAAYVWAPECGTGLTNGGGVCYERGDYVADGVHPSASGQQKVGSLLHARFRQHRWYRR